MLPYDFILWLDLVYFEIFTTPAWVRVYVLSSPKMLFSGL